MLNVIAIDELIEFVSELAVGFTDVTASVPAHAPPAAINGTDAERATSSLAGWRFITVLLLPSPNEPTRLSPAIGSLQPLFAPWREIERLGEPAKAGIQNSPHSCSASS